VHLLSADGEHVQVDAVEFIEAAPQPTLCEPLVDFAHALVIHLVAALQSPMAPPPAEPMYSQEVRLKKNTTVLPYWTP
jgi:hypothetical protein